MTARQTALSLLLKWEQRDGFANLLLSDRLLAEAGEEAGFLTALFYGTVERRLTLDYWIGALSDRSLEDISLGVKCILRLGLYQLLYMKIPPHAAVSQTVSLAKDRGERGFINAVLRRADRQRDAMPLPPSSKRARYLSVAHSIPQGTVRRLLALYGEETEALLASFNEVKPLTLTARSREVREKLLAHFARDGIRAERARYSPLSLRVTDSVAPTSLYGFREGLFLVQDEASAIAALALDPQRGDTLIDVCAAPGGKTMCAALLCEGEGEFYAFDLHESKLSLIRDTAARLSLPIQTEAVDATEGREALFGRADRVICDVPCSGLGVLGKKPDLRYREVSEELSSLGYRILCASARYVRTGGVLLYSTCTLTNEENRDNVLRFIAEHADFTLEDFAVEDTERVESEGGMLTLLPTRHGTDGFFMAKLRKK